MKGDLLRVSWFFEVLSESQISSLGCGQGLGALGRESFVRGRCSWRWAVSLSEKRPIATRRLRMGFPFRESEEADGLFDASIVQFSIRTS